MLTFQFFQDQITDCISLKLEIFKKEKRKKNNMLPSDRIKKYKFNSLLLNLFIYI